MCQSCNTFPTPRNTLGYELEVEQTFVKVEHMFRQSVEGQELLLRPDIGVFWDMFVISLFIEFWDGS